MARLDDVSASELEETLLDLEGYREVRRLLAAIIYKRGPSVPMIADWLDVREATIYRWFDRMETEALEDAIADDPRPGRPSKLTDGEWEQFRAALAEPPTAVGYDASAWTDDVARRYLADEFDVVYSRRHVRRLLGDAPEA